MMIPDSYLQAARLQAFNNRAVPVDYLVETQVINRGTGAITTTPITTTLDALVSGEKRKEGAITRTFRVFADRLPATAPSLKDSVTYGDYTYRIYDWQTSQHGDVVDLVCSRG